MVINWSPKILIWSCKSVHQYISILIEEYKTNIPVAAGQEGCESVSVKRETALISRPNFSLNFKPLPSHILMSSLVDRWHCGILGVLMELSISITTP